MLNFGPFNVRASDANSTEFHTLQKLGMQMAPHNDGQGFDLTIPPQKFFVIEADSYPGMSAGKILSVHEHRTGNAVAQLYESDTIDLRTLSNYWTVSVHPPASLTPSPPAKKVPHLKLVPKPGEQ